MAWIEISLAVLTVAVCALLLVRLALGAPRRERFDAAAIRLWVRLRDTTHTVAAAPRQRRAARREAAEVIQRARRKTRVEAQRDGNVVRPDAFRRPKKPH